MDVGGSDHLVYRLDLHRRPHALRQRVAEAGLRRVRGDRPDPAGPFSGAQRALDHRASLMAAAAPVDRDLPADRRAADLADHVADRADRLRGGYAVEFQPGLATTGRVPRTIARGGALDQPGSEPPGPGGDGPGATPTPVARAGECPGADLSRPDAERARDRLAGSAGSGPGPLLGRPEPARRRSGSVSAAALGGGRAVAGLAARSTGVPRIGD